MRWRGDAKTQGSGHFLIRIAVQTLTRGGVCIHVGPRIPITMTLTEQVYEVFYLTSGRGDEHATTALVLCAILAYRYLVCTTPYPVKV